ncbi:hypothetical protein DCAR_0729470 [Daucus carota subsp. sativus]|uniref:Uncharacterized protein n=1 Tax=Daucus carota subsp. sativus TaxID=79200 RepID=A0A161Y7Z5_DAUCS|nr:PREDICTED: uncharacterized protein LOC108195449 [Daucus carota subsp. sativus]WOH10009.1 hypothetical protein DCAR_0729470 [Daucus carota subsp. sativus]
MDSHKARTPLGSHKFLHKSGRLDSLRNVNSQKIKTPGCTQRAATKADHLKDISEGLSTSKELLKILDYTWEMDDRSCTFKSLVAALKCELEQTEAKVGKLIQEQQVEESKMGCLMKKFAKERYLWKTKEQERIQNAVESIARELQVEKKLKCQFERLNRKLGKELATTKASIFTIEKAFDSANTRSRKGENINGDDTEMDYSPDSDLHSIEFNMDNNCKTYDWSFISASRKENYEDQMLRCNMIKNVRDRIVYGS